MPDISGKLFPNALTVIVQLLSTGVLFIVFKIFLWKPLLEYFKKRADYIESTIVDAKEMNETAKENMELADQKAKEAAIQYHQIIEDAKIDANKAKESIIEEANKEAGYKLMQAQKDIENEKEKARREMKEEIVDIALDVASKVMEKDMNTTTNEQLADGFVRDVIN